MKRILLTATVIGVGLFAGRAIAEVLVRVLAPHSRDHVVPAGMFAADTALGWKLNPRAVTRHRTRYFDAEYGINAPGFHWIPAAHARIAAPLIPALAR